MQITIPDLCLVVLIGVSSSGKSTFARKHFLPTEVLSSDACRALVADDENDLAATTDAFEVLHFIAGKRLAAGKLTVVDATNVQPQARRPLVELARERYCQPVAIVFNLPERVCQERSRQRPDRTFGPHVIRRQAEQLRRSLRGLAREGFRQVAVLSLPEEVDAATVARRPLPVNRQQDRGPFDIIGDVHGCFDELLALLDKLGYQVTSVDGVQNAISKVQSDQVGGVRPGTGKDQDTTAAGAGQALASGRPRYVVHHRQGRKAIFLGDLVDRGPDSPGVLRLVMDMVAAGNALCVPGNHDDKLRRKLIGRDVQVAHGLAQTLEQLEPEPPEFKQAVAAFVDSLPSHYVLDGGQLVVAHAGMKEVMQGRATGRVRDFALYGETTGETDEFGLPVRLNWAADYRGRATVVYGHTPVPQAQWLNNTINVDTGCVFGGQLTALRYPERELISVPAARVYYEPARPVGTGASSEGRVARSAAGVAAGERTAGALAPSALAPSAGDARHVPPTDTQHSALSTQYSPGELLDIQDVLGRRVVETRLHHAATIREEQAAAALEVMSRFAADPRWLIYLPPTMSPSETSRAPGLLEHPAEALAYYRQEGVARVICEEKHMGSRAVVIVCRDERVARDRFGIHGADMPGDLVGAGATGELGICYTRTGRRFFEDAAMERALLERVRSAATAAGLWDALQTDWLCLDCELMPWSAKAQALLQGQYAAVGAAARAALPEAIAALRTAAARQQRILSADDAPSATPRPPLTSHLDDAPFADRGSDSSAVARAFVPRNDDAPTTGDAAQNHTGANGDIASLLARFERRLADAERFVEAYRRYCWPVESIADLRLAPFHLLASEGAVHVDKDHGWHMAQLARLCAADPDLLLATPFRTVDLADSAAEDEAVQWWQELTAAGGEGMVVKPYDFVATGRRGLIQPAIKCRGREYLRIIYGPEYTEPEHLERLRARGLGAKRALALREFALGVEALERFVRREPLYRLHECVFGIMALESEPVDPRL